MSEQIPIPRLKLSGQNGEHKKAYAIVRPVDGTDSATIAFYRGTPTERWPFFTATGSRAELETWLAALQAALRR